jgi:hypothetical protein
MPGPTPGPRGCGSDPVPRLLEAARIRIAASAFWALRAAPAGAARLRSLMQVGERQGPASFGATKPV